MFGHHCSKTMLFFICIAITLKRISFFFFSNKRKGKEKLPAELLEPNFLQPEYKIEIQVLEGSSGLNLRFRFLSDAAMGRTFQVKTSVNGILSTEQVPHNDKANLLNSCY